MLLPYVGYVKPTDRKSLRTLQEDIEDFAKRKINIETGQIYLDSGEKVDSENPYEIEDPTQFEYENIFLFLTDQWKGIWKHKRSGVRISPCDAHFRRNQYFGSSATSH